MFSPFDLLASFRQGSARRSATRALRGLTAAQLADLGITPDQIDDIVDAALQRSRAEADVAAVRAASAARRALPAAAGRTGR